MLKTGRTDLRRGIDGLKAVISLNGMDPLEKGTLFLFCSRRNDRIRGLTFENDGFVMLYKRLDAHVGRYQWPRNRNEVKAITWRQFDWLMSGLEIDQPKAIQRR